MSRRVKCPRCDQKVFLTTFGDALSRNEGLLLDLISRVQDKRIVLEFALAIFNKEVNTLCDRASADRLITPEQDAGLRASLIAQFQIDHQKPDQVPVNMECVP